MSSGLDRLRNRFKSVRRRASDGRYYYDPVALKIFCTSQVIGDAVRECSFPIHQRDQITDDIIANGVITFCILVYTGHQNLMIKFQQRDPYNAGDSRIPLDENVLRGIAGEAASDFFEAQWKFRPVVLAKYRHLQLDDDCILPFDEDEHSEEQDGSFGAIHMVCINRFMQNLIDTTEPAVKVIRKQLRFSRNTADFDRERECLEILQDLKHPNIVELLCSYTYKKEHSLVFKNEGINLNAFLGQERPVDFESDTVFFRALYGLASAIDYIHGCNIGGEGENTTIIGCHHDIRPHNILVRRDTFVLADFGLAKMGERDSSSASYRGGGGDYVAPECLPKGARVKSAADIWSFGGVVVDIASYMKGGPKARNDAQDRRESPGPYPGMTSSYFFSGDEVKKAVRDTIKDLKQDPKDKTTRTLLLLSEAMLKVDPDDRPDADVVRDNAAYIAIKSLFRSALKEMIQWKKQSQERGPGRIWEDTWKLWAWGEEIGINGARLVPESFKDALPRYDETAKRLEKRLAELVKLITIQVRERKSAIQEQPRRSADSPIVFTMESEKINDGIRNLKYALPERYRTRIEERKGDYHQFAKKEPHLLPTLSDETLQPTESSAVTSPALSYLAKTSTGISSLADQSAITTPSTHSSLCGDPNKALPAIPPLPGPAVAINGSLPEHRPTKVAELSADVSFSIEKSDPWKHSCGIDVSRVEVAGKIHTAIQCISKDSGIKLRHESKLIPSCEIASSDVKSNRIAVWRSASSYPHTEHPRGDVGNTRTVRFLGQQVLFEQPQWSPKERFLKPENVCYTFTSPGESKNFRQNVWGKQLLIRAGAKGIAWDLLKETTTLSVSLWKEWTGPAAFSIVFRAQKRRFEGWELIELRLAQPKPYEKQNHEILHLKLDPASVAKHDASGKKSHGILKVTFDKEQECTTFKRFLVPAPKPS